MSVHLVPVIVGFIGDILTFGGSSLLAWDALAPEKAFQDEQKVIAVFSHPALKELLVDMGEKIVSSSDDVKALLMHRRAKKAKAGFVLLALGFAALLATRILDFAKCF